MVILVLQAGPWGLLRLHGRCRVGPGIPEYHEDATVNILGIYVFHQVHKLAYNPYYESQTYIANHGSFHEWTGFNIDKHDGIWMHLT